jgi:hypothetical protein
VAFPDSPLGSGVLLEGSENNQSLNSGLHGPLHASRMGIRAARPTVAVGTDGGRGGIVVDEILDPSGGSGTVAGSDSTPVSSWYRRGPHPALARPRRVASFVG